jgi:hypothetical protein
MALYSSEVFFAMVVGMYLFKVIESKQIIINIVESGVKHDNTYN